MKGVSFLNSRKELTENPVKNKLIGDDRTVVILVQKSGLDFEVLLRGASGMESWIEAHELIGTGLLPASIESRVREIRLC